MLKFNPKRIVGSWKGQIGTRDFAVALTGGFYEGDFIKAKYDSARIIEHEGSDGTVTILLNASSKATLSFILVQGSPLNDEMSKLVGDYKRNYLPVGALNFEDLNGTTKIKAPNSWIRESAEVTFGNKVAGREWIMGLADAEIFVGGGGDF